MKTSIKTYDDLEGEKLRLQSDLRYQRNLIQDDFEMIRVELKPIQSILHRFGKINNSLQQHPILRVGVDLIGGIILKKILLGRAGLVLKIVAPLLAKNFSALVLSKEGGNAVQKIAQTSVRLAGRLKKLF